MISQKHVLLGKWKKSIYINKGGNFKSETKMKSNKTSKNRNKLKTTLFYLSRDSKNKSGEK